jgi:hypothetical protein
MFEGDLIEGELEIGQIGLIHDIKSAEAYQEMITDFDSRQEIINSDFNLYEMIKTKYISYFFLVLGLQHPWPKL